MDQISAVPRVRIAALYRFAAIARPEALCAPLQDFCRARGIRGTLLLASEGVNGTVAGVDDAIDALVKYLSSHAGLDGMEIKYSYAEAMPFHRMKVRLKREIVTMGIEGIDPVGAAGAYVEPGDWNDLIGDPDTVVIDTRNRYETQLGTFAGALDPATDSFRDFPEWLSANRERLAGRKVAMFCTGGIRCEKATAYARSIGIEEVFHLKGGILKYLEEVPQAGSLWQGECFVFDERVSVGHGLAEGDATLCRACRRPLTAQDRASPHHAEGIACVHCHADRSEADRARYAERQRQVEIAAKSGKVHIGG